MSVNIGGDDGVEVRSIAAGIQFRSKQSDGNGNFIFCVVPSADWWSAWDKLKRIKTESDMVQWSYIDRNHNSMVLCESYVEFKQNIYQINFSCRVVRLLPTKEFSDIKAFSENKGQ